MFGKAGDDSGLIFRTKLSLNCWLGRSPSKGDVICCPEAVIIPDRLVLVVAASAQIVRARIVSNESRIDRKSLKLAATEITLSPPVAGPETKTA